MSSYLCCALNGRVIVRDDNAMRLVGFGQIGRDFRGPLGAWKAVTLRPDGAAVWQVVGGKVVTP